MSDPEVRLRVSAKLKGRPFPVARGGNGRGPTEPQRLLAAALGWKMEVAVGIPLETRRTFSTRGSNYKVDIGNSILKIAVEVDGASHFTKKIQATDARKTAILASLGWRVLRFSNQEILKDPIAAANTVLASVSSTLK
ncbi:MAG: DUF559 domain-containing protein [Dehalococcoidia bacterium]|nr:DUF559 domain-containing protein [Dehalococcoidia bacterium]